MRKQIMAMYQNARSMTWGAAKGSSFTVIFLWFPQERFEGRPNTGGVYAIPWEESSMPKAWKQPRPANSISPRPCP
jgi:hypothetical protein